jgi:hypothetical protein
MLSSVLTSERALEVNITIMRTFVKLRQLLATHAELAHRLDALEWREGERDGKVQYVFGTIQHLIEAPEPEPKRPIGFPTDQGWRVARQADSLYSVMSGKNSAQVPIWAKPPDSAPEPAKRRFRLSKGALIALVAVVLLIGEILAWRRFHLSDLQIWLFRKVAAWDWRPPLLPSLSRRGNRRDLAVVATPKMASCEVKSAD